MASKNQAQVKSSIKKAVKKLGGRPLSHSFTVNTTVKHRTHGKGEVVGIGGDHTGAESIAVKLASGKEFNGSTKGWSVVKLDGDATAIRKAFADANGASHEVWVATRKKPEHNIGYVESIDDIKVDEVCIGVEGVGHHERNINTLVLYVSPRKKVGDAAGEKNTTWAVGTTVEHPAHGVGIVCGHTHTDGIVLVEFENPNVLGALEIVADELKLVQLRLLHKPHTKKAFNFPKRKQAVKQAKATAKSIGTAQEQNAAYAKLALKYRLNDRVVELNSEKREGNVFSVARTGSGYVDVLFCGSTSHTPVSKHVSDLKKVDMKNHKIFIGDLVSMKGSNERLGSVSDAHFSSGRATVNRDGVHTDVLLSQLKRWGAPKLKNNEETTKFENLPLLSGFTYKEQEHVKVGNTSAIQTTIDRETLGGYVKHPVVRLAEIGFDKMLTKVRLKKDTQVKPIVSVPHGA